MRLFYKIMIAVSLIVGISRFILCGDYPYSLGAAFTFYLLLRMYDEGVEVFP